MENPVNIAGFSTFYLTNENNNEAQYKSNSTNSSTNVIGKPKKIGNLEIAQFDFNYLMTDEEATQACEQLGNNWRLPKENELKVIFKNKAIIGGLSKDYYWCVNDEDFYHAFNVGKGTTITYVRWVMGENAKIRVRAVRSKSK